MTLRFVHGNLFDVPADVRVCTVNCVGAMGKGVALAFRRRYPGLFDSYRAACDRGELAPGRLHVWRGPDAVVICLPTKRHWRDGSRYEDIATGLRALRDYLVTRPGLRVVLPALGCGNCGLDWSRVRAMLVEHLGHLDAAITAIEPESTRFRPRDCFPGRYGPPSSVDAWRDVSERTGLWATAACRALGVRAIVSGGQDGVDVGALRWALALGLPAGGWAPRGMRAESGRVVADVAGCLREHVSTSYADRTRSNVRAADAVLVVAASGTAGPGTTRTLADAARARRPALVLEPGPGSAHWDALRLVGWLAALPTAPDTVLMIAGPRASRWPAGEREVVRVLGAALAAVAPPVVRLAVAADIEQVSGVVPNEVRPAPWSASGVAIW